MSRIIARIPEGSIRMEVERQIEGNTHQFKSFFGRKVSFFKENSDNLQKQYIQAGIKSDALIADMRSRNHNTYANDLERLQEVRFGNPVTCAHGRNFIKLLNSTVKMGKMKPKNRDTAVKIHDLSNKQRKIAKELHKRGVPQSDLEALLEIARSALTQENERVEIKIVSFDDTIVGTDIQNLVEGLLKGYKDVTKEDAQKHFKVAGMFTRDKKNQKPLEVGKALMNAYVDPKADKQEVIELLKAYSSHFPGIAWSALDKLYMNEKESSFQSELNQAMTQIVEAHPKNAKAFHLFSESKDALTPKKFGDQIAKSKMKRGSKEWNLQVQKFSNLIVHNDVMNMKSFQPEIDLLPREAQPSDYRSKLSEDSQNLCTFVSLTIMEQKNPKKMTKVYNFFLDVMQTLGEKKIGERKGDAQGMNIMMASLAQTCLSRLVDKDKINPDPEAVKFYQKEIAVQSSNNPRVKATADAAMKMISLYVANEQGDINTILQNDDLRDQLSLLAEKKVPGYLSLKEDLKGYSAPEHDIKLFLSPRVTEDELYAMSYKISPRKMY